jgi:CrcB protein
MLLLYIAAGSAIGGVTRYLVGFAIQQRAGVEFPLGTLIINITGSLLLGFLLRAALEGVSVSPEVRAFLTTGFCGGYTTFSTFSYDTVALVQGGEYRRAMTYVILSVVLSLVATFAGVALAQSTIVALRARP